MSSFKRNGSQFPSNSAFWRNGWLFSHRNVCEFDAFNRKYVVEYLTSSSVSVYRIDTFARIDLIVDKFMALRISSNTDEQKNHHVCLAATRPVRSVTENELRFDFSFKNKKNVHNCFRFTTLTHNLLKSNIDLEHLRVDIKDVMYQTQETVFYHIFKLVFLTTNFEVFGNVVIHCHECSIYLLNENWNLLKLRIKRRKKS